jgi:putative ABC transport system permease protein
VSPWLVVAARNLVRNRRRSLYTMLAVGLAFAAVNVFGGFTHYVFEALRDSHIYAQARGHLSLFARSPAAAASADPALIEPQVLERAQDLLSAMAQVRVVSPVLQVQGLVSNGRLSTVFVGQGHTPSLVQRIRESSTGMSRRIRLFEGRPLQDSRADGVGIGPGVARLLGLEVGAGLVVVAPTLAGQINAVDAEVFQIIATPAEFLDDKLLSVPLELARSLYDTPGGDRLDVLLREGADLESTRRQVEARLAAEGLPLVARGWRELAPFYVKVERMFQIIFGFIFVIVLVIVVMSVINTVSTAVLERTREIGTLRALGVRRRGVVGLFALESALLGLGGGVLGIALQLASVGLVVWLEPSWVPPQMSQAVPLEVHLVPGYMALTFLTLVALSFLAAVLPARRVAGRNIVGALGHA